MLFDPINDIINDQGKAVYYPTFLDRASADRHLEDLKANVPWIQEPIKIFGREMMQPRLTAWYGDPGISYSYSGITMDPIPWNPTLLNIKSRVEAISDTFFNSALLNYYRHGQDSMGWHRDNEPELGPNPVIASVSLGGGRRFHLRKYRDKSVKHTIELTHGSLLLMSGELQHHWEHQIPKTARQVEGRINITFRKILK